MGGNILSPKLDFLFKLLFGDERNVDILRNFLTAVLELPKDELEQITLLNTELKKEHEDDKLGILDVNLRTKNDTEINLEIQVINKQDYEKRVVYYTSKRLIEQLGKGDPYTKLCQTISINIIDFDFFPYEKYHSTHYMIEETEQTKLTDLLRIDFLELPKARSFSIEQTEDVKLLWMHFINSETEGELNMLAKKNDVFKKPVAEVKRLSGDELIRAEYDARQKAIRDRMAEMEYAINTGLKRGKEEGIREGIKEGIKQGIEKKAFEAAINFLKLGVSVDIVAKGTGLSEQQILKLKEELEII